MTEAEWLACDEPETLLEFVHGRMTTRKCRLLAAAFCRQVLPLTTDRCCQRAVEVAEQFADGLARLEEMLAVSEQVAEVYLNVPQPASVNTEPWLSFKAESIAIQSTMFLTQDTDNYLGACRRCTDLATLRREMLRAGPDETINPYSTMMQWQNVAIRDVIGNPFHRLTLDPKSRTTDVIRLAEACYEERELPGGHLDPARLSVLADALEEAGCNVAEVLTHLRGGGEHVRGCFAIDLVLQRL